MRTYAGRACKGAGPEMKREQAEGAHPRPSSAGRPAIILTSAA